MRRARAASPSPRFLGCLLALLLAGCAGGPVAPENAPGAFAKATPAEVSEFLLRFYRQRGFTASAASDHVVAEAPVRGHPGWTNRVTIALYGQEGGTLLLGQWDYCSRKSCRNALGAHPANRGGLQKELDGIAAEIAVEQGGGVGAMLKGDPPLVHKLAPGGPAEKAGLEPGDRIVRIDGNLVGTTLEARSLLVGPVGKDVEVTVLRDGREITLRMTRISYRDSAGKLAAPPASSKP